MSPKRETKAARARRVEQILEALDREYGREYRCYLNYETPWQLLIAVMLSAQCTDARVNIVTADLFPKYKTIEAFAGADIRELEEDIRSIGFYHSKAKKYHILLSGPSHPLWGPGAPLGRRSDLPGRSRQKDSQCDPGKHLPRTKRRSGYPCKADLQKAGPDCGGGA